MAVGLGLRQAADEEARAEVEVLNSRLEKHTEASGSRDEYAVET